MQVASRPREGTIPPVPLSISLASAHRRTHRAGANSIGDRVLAVHLRESDSGTLVGVALLVPSERYAATLINGAAEVRERKLTPAVWRAIDKWVINGDGGLPAEPAPLGPAVVAALLEHERPPISGHRVASFSLNARGNEGLTSSVRRLLRQLRDAPRPATLPPLS